MHIVKNNDEHTGERAVTASDKMAQKDYSENYHFNPDDYLIKILTRAVANKQDISVKHPSGDKLAIFPSRGDYYSWVSDMENFCRTDIKQFSVNVLNETECQECRKGSDHGRNFDELLWQSTYYASQGRLIKGCEREDVIEIRYWPNLTRLPGPSSSIAIAALLTRFPTSITLASHILKVPLGEMFEFYSAAFSAGFVKVHNRMIDTPKLKPHRDNTMLGQLLSRISRL